MEYLLHYKSTYSVVVQKSSVKLMQTGIYK